MVRKTEYDFLNYTSFPSSMKAINDEEKFVPINLLYDYPVEGGDTVKVSAMVKGENIDESHIAVRYFDGETWRNAPKTPIFLPKGNYDWREITLETAVDTPAQMLRVTVYGGQGPGTQPSTTWVDDAEVYVNDELVKAESFSNWTPYLVGGTIVGGVAGARYAEII